MSGLYGNMRNAFKKVKEKRLELEAFSLKFYLVLRRFSLPSEYDYQ